MFVSFASGTLIVLGVILTVLGVFAGGSIAFTLIGLGAVAGGGVIGLLEVRVSR
jgi:hypothetical protein